MMMTAGTPKTKLLPSHHHQHISTRFFYRLDALPWSNQQHQSSEGRL